MESRRKIRIDEDSEVDVWSHGESNEVRILRWMCER